MFVAAPGVTTRTFGGRLLACPPITDLAATAPVIAIEGTAAAAWSRLATPTSRGALARALAEHFDADAATIARDLDPLLVAWRAAGLIVTVP